jgi:hypothetical protein
MRKRETEFLIFTVLGSPPLRFRDDETAPRKPGYLPILLLLAGLLLAGLL